jgi:O-antigen ligase
MEKENKYLWLYLTGFFLILTLPLLNLPPWFSPPDWGKTIVFRSILAILLFVFVYQILFQKQKDNTFGAIASKVLWRKNKVFWPFWLLIALLGVFFLATLFSLDRTFSFWGNPYRSGGFLNFASYIIFAILAFLVLRKSDWQKIWTFSFFVAILVCLIAIFQRFKILSNIFVSVSDQPWSTIGGSTFLAVYLLILSFLALSFAIKSIKNLNRKWFFYLPALLLFLFVILLTISRAAYLGLLIGLIYFFLPYFKKIIKRPKVLVAVSLLILIIAVSFFSFYSNKLPQRLSINRFLNDPRFSVWRISAETILENPILGYGPENFSIAFDKYYDPSLPKMALATEEPIPTTWYDRAHNSLIDIGVTAGIPALIIYLGIFASIFWALQKVKHNSDPLICHGVQSAFIAYLTANFFGFDIFSTYLVSFLLIGFSLSLISKKEEVRPPLFSGGRTSIKAGIKYPVVIILFIGLGWFIWAYNIKPFQINTEINKSLLETRKGQSERALRRMENIFPSDTFLNDYLRANYIEVINVYVLREPTKAIELIPKGIKIMKSTIEIRPNYTRYWIMLGNYHNILLENYQDIYPKLAEKWKNEADYAFGKALELSPKRQEILINWSKTYFLTGDYKTAEEKIQKCIELNPEYGACWWNLALINVKENNIEEAKKNIEIARSKNYPIDNNEIQLLDLKRAYLSLENYEQYLEEICELNYKLVLTTRKIDYKLNLLTCYIKTNNFEETKKLTEEIIREWVGSRDNAAAKTNLLALRKDILALKNYQNYYEEICLIDTALTVIDFSNPEYKMDLFECFLKIGDKQASQKLATVIKKGWPEYTEEIDKLIREAGL